MVTFLTSASAASITVSGAEQCDDSNVIAAACLSLILVGALATKLRHHESAALPAAAMLLAVLVAVERVH